MKAKDIIRKQNCQQYLSKVHTMICNKTLANTTKYKKDKGSWLRGVPLRKVRLDQYSK
jgi:hypothetical protein